MERRELLEILKGLLRAIAVGNKDLEIRAEKEILEAEAAIAADERKA